MIVFLESEDQQAYYNPLSSPVQVSHSPSSLACMKACLKLKQATFQIFHTFHAKTFEAISSA